MLLFGKIYIHRVTLALIAIIHVKDDAAWQGEGIIEVAHEDRTIQAIRCHISIFSGYERGDVIIISHATRMDESIIKRVIAVGGDTVDIDFYKGTVSVNGQVLDEPYVNTPTNLSYDMTFPVTVPDGKLFVLGDNRNDSLDSRSTDIGFINENKVLGKVVFRFYPFDKIEIIKN